MVVGKLWVACFDLQWLQTDSSKLRSPQSPLSNPRLEKEDSRKFECHVKECGRRYNHQSSLCRHLKIDHRAALPKAVGKRFSCGFPGCKQTFAYQASAYRHKKTHSDIRIRHTCKEPGCQRSYSQAADLRRHVRTKHGTGRPNPRSGLPDPRHLQKNGPSEEANPSLRIRSDGKRFMCDQPGCIKNYPSKNSLYHHQRRAHGKEVQQLHQPSTDGKRFVCSFPDCGKHYTHKAYLYRHVKQVHVKQSASHTKSPQFKCDFPGCGKQYKFIEALRRHQDAGKHAGGSLYSTCGLNGCQLLFSSKESLERHRRLSHGLW